MLKSFQYPLSCQMEIDVDIRKKKIHRQWRGKYQIVAENKKNKLKNARMRTKSSDTEEKERH
jgi:hypothetical protein